MRSTLSSKSGFTLLELLVAVGIIGLALAVATPSLRGWQQNMQVRAAAQNLYSVFQQARTLAVKNNCTMAIRCVATSPGVPGGYELFVDDGGSGSGTAGDLIKNGDEATVGGWVEMAKSVELTSPSFGGSATTGINSQGLPASTRSGSVKVGNDSRTFTITLTPAGGVLLD